MTKKKIAQSKPRTKRAAEKPVDAEIRRAAERMGIPLPEYALKGLVAPMLVKACDQLGEEIAACADCGGDSDNVVDALLTLWKLRWELGLTPNHVEDEHAEQSPGGAP
jgi:hypothetical protein